MLIKNLHRAGLTHENGLDAQRLLPWPELNAPFEGSWCVIRPGTASTPHAHHEYEIFIALRGEAFLESGGERVPFNAGDIVHFPPHQEHRVVNDSDTDFEMYSVWWDAEMSERFTARHTSQEGVGA
ncbi:cupin domain-containing protein [Streptomyces sp. NPDC002176]|uniref:cupin domain-containing protein n=1 Tax=Streptomyces sp. NPDC002176 TaxID=3364634 RepID=UPI00384E0103